MNTTMSPTRYTLLTNKSEKAMFPMYDTSFADIKHIISECETLASEREKVRNSVKAGRPRETFEDWVRGHGTED